MSPRCYIKVMQGQKHQRSVSWNFSSPPESPRFPLPGLGRTGPGAPKLKISGKPPFSQTKSVSHLPSLSSQSRLKPLVPAPSYELLPITHHRTRSHQLAIPLRQKTNRRSNSDQQDLPNHVSKCVYTSCRGESRISPKSVNQDAYIVEPFLHGQKGQYLFAVCDGHGPQGHRVSQFIKSHFPTLLTRAMLPARNSPAELAAALKSAIARTDTALAESPIDSTLSGSTLACVCVSGSYLISANIGDSRIVVGQYKGGWCALQLTRDHKPGVPEEAARIRSCGGRVAALQRSEGVFAGVERVWLKHKNVPGLAMSRSIGDKVAASVGVTAEPELATYSFKTHDKFIILATDGVWEMVSNQEAVELIGQALEHGDLETSGEMLVQLAFERWQQSAGNVDDITAIVFFLSPKPLKTCK